ncbi:hypothetical protein EJ994_13360 [Maribacter sp. MJ134]|uniref:hypothetical protein n=1 Tax=Maribacter sp. MJ134 TaxID=2496865 RepID=UPI000F82D243|nr:hypothetical protein [Maribacter sp. MJ134]AZQ59735.1 hypothetical protein EJ994_13360 [Maribacter sp. MJ134]
MKLQEKIETVVKTEEIQSVSIDLAESVVDLALDDGLLRDIPLIGSIVGLSKGYFTIKDRLLTKKLLYFLTELQTIPLEERQKQIKKINSSEKYESSVGDKLLFVIDKAEDSRIASLIGKLFRLNILSKLSYNTFISCTQIINTSNIDLIRFQCVTNLLHKVEFNDVSEINLPHYLSELNGLNTSQLLILRWVVIRNNETSDNLRLKPFYNLLMEDSELEQSEEVVMFKSNLFQLGFKHILDPTSGLNTIPDFPKSVSPTEYAFQLFNAYGLEQIVEIDIEIIDKLLRRK